MTFMCFRSDATADGAIPPSNFGVICVKVFLRENLNVVIMRFIFTSYLYLLKCLILLFFKIFELFLALAVHYKRNYMNVP